MSLQNWWRGLSAALLAGVLAGCGGSDPKSSVIDVARSDARLGILAEAVAAADLSSPRSEAGPAELGVSKEQLVANKALLTKVLTYHVLSSRVLKAEVPVGAAITTVARSSVTVDATLAITDANGRKAAITATDVLPSNGVIHVIDRVTLPKL